MQEMIINNILKIEMFICRDERMERKPVKWFNGTVTRYFKRAYRLYDASIFCL